MQDEKQYEQLMLQYSQLKNGAEDIRRMIENEDFDSALTMIKSREELIVSTESNTTPKELRLFSRYRQMNAVGLIIPISRIYVISVV